MIIIAKLVFFFFNVMAKDISRGCCNFLPRNKMGRQSNYRRSRETLDKNPLPFFFRTVVVCDYESCGS